MAALRDVVRADDPDFSEWARAMLDNEESDFSGEEGECVGPDFQSDHDSESEQGLSDNEEEHIPRNILVPKPSTSKKQYSAPSLVYVSDQEVEDPTPKKKRKRPKSYFGKNKFKWSSEAPPGNVRTRAHNIISHIPGIIGSAKQLGQYCTQQSAWELLFREDMMDEVLLRTNEKLASVREKLADENRVDYRDLSIEELKAFYGLLMFTAVFKSNNEDLCALFSTDGTGRDIFRSVMSLKRISVLLVCLRFDNSFDRAERKKDDPTAPISWLFERFVENCQECYSIGEYACVDEMLVGFRGKCRFKMYIPNKPRKYGLKIMVLNDAKTHYFLNGYIYSGKDSDGITLSADEKKFSKPTQAVVRLSKPIAGTNRNVTADNWFSSLELVRELKKNGLTYVGTLRKNKREVPPAFLPARGRQEMTSLYGFTEDITLVSFVPKKNKAVLLLSSMHHGQSTDSITGKPEVIVFYNETKGGVDSLDEKCAVYSTSRRANRWPLAVFFAMLNISLVNAFVLFSAFPGNPVQSRVEFVKTLAKELVEPALRTRLRCVHLPRELRLTISRILGEPLPLAQRQNDGGQLKRCGICPRRSDRKTKVACAHCSVPICAQCTIRICQNCAK